MRRLLVLIVLAAGACGDNGSGGGGGSSGGGAPGGTSSGGGSSGGGTSGGGGSGGGLPTSTGPVPDHLDPDVPASTTYQAPTVASGQTYWKLVTLEYYPPGESSSVGGDHHIYFRALDFDGTPLEGQIGRATVYDNTLYAETKGAVDGYWGNIPMFGTSWCTADIDDSPGPYSFEMTQDGLPSTRVDGMGLHCNHHSTWRLEFRKTVAP